MRFQCGCCGEILQTDHAGPDKTILCSRCGNEVPVPDPPFAPGTVIADYVIRGKIAEGDMGRIFLAEHLKNGTKTALKILAKEHSYDAAFIVSFIRQGRLAAEKTFRHAVKVLSVGEDNGVFYYAMEYIEGRPFAEILKTEAPLPVELAVKAVEQIAEALEDSLKMGKIVHRSIKPDNILVTKDGEFKLADLGLARDYLDLAARSEEEKQRLIQYVSPETFSDFSLSALGPESDIYSLGAVLYHAVTGQSPYQGFSSSEIISAKIPQEPVSPSRLRPEISGTLASVILKMMARAPEDRYHDPSELLEALRSVRSAGNEPDAAAFSQSGNASDAATVKLAGKDRAKNLNVLPEEEGSLSQLDVMQRRRETRSKTVVLLIAACLMSTVIILVLFIRWLVYEPQKSSRTMELNIARMKENAERKILDHAPLKRGSPELLCRGVVAFCSNDDFSSALRYYGDFIRRYPVDPKLAEIIEHHLNGARVFFNMCRNGGAAVAGMPFRSVRHGACTVERVRDSVLTIRTKDGETAEIPLLSMSREEYNDFLRNIAGKFGLSSQMRSYLACTGDFETAIVLSPDETEQREFDWIAYGYIRSGIVHASPVEIRHLRMLYGSLDAFRRAIRDTGNN